MDSSFKNKKIVKVCKIDNFEFAKYAIHSGVAYLGVHILEENNIGKHLDLIRYIKNSKGEVVIVTKVAGTPKSVSS